MTTKVQKGMAFQRWIKAYLEEKEYTVHNQTSCGKMVFLKNKSKIFVSTRNDIFGAIDLIAIKKAEPTLWIQATLSTSLKVKREKLQVMKVICNERNSVQLWVKRKIRVIDIYDMDDKGEFKLMGKIMRRKFYTADNFGCEDE